jgi:hypothetical protein
VEQRENAELRLLPFRHQLGLTEQDFCAQPNPLVALLLRPGNSTRIPPQERQGSRYGF